MKKVLLLGNTGKMGTALRKVFREGYCLTGKSSRDFDANNFEQVQRLIEENNPDILINTVAFLGIDPCEKEPEMAFRMNALYPRFLAELSRETGFLLIHFSTDAVFNDAKGDYYTEKDAPLPLNIYGFTKFGGDCFVQTIAECFYIFRVSILFGETTKESQFVEKMLRKVVKGEKSLKISNDIISSPSYSSDIAKEVRNIVNESLPFGLYHIANDGMASLYDLMQEIADNLKLDVSIEKASYNDFSYIGTKNTYTPIKSEKRGPLRSWQEAVKEYCNDVASVALSSNRNL